MTLTKSAEADLQALLPYLLSGGAGALAGGTLTAATPERFGEDSEARRKRVLRNALMMGAGTAAGHAGLSYGIPKVTRPLPAATPSQLERGMDGVKSNPWYYAAGGLGLAADTARVARKEELRAVNGRIDSQNSAEVVAGHKPPLAPAAKGSVPSKVVETIRGEPTLKRFFDNLDDKSYRNMGVNPEKMRYNEGFKAPMPKFRGLSRTGGIAGAILGAAGGVGMNAATGGDSDWTPAVGAAAGGAAGATTSRFLKDLFHSDRGSQMATTAVGGAKLLGSRTFGRSMGGAFRRGAPLAALLGVPQILSAIARSNNPEAFNQ